MYSQNPLSYGSLATARELLSQHPDSREMILDCLVAIECQMQPGSHDNIREQLTGPLTDLLFDSGERLERRVAGGLTIGFRYTSKIARDFVLARQQVPSHVWEPQTTRALVSLASGGRNVIIGGAYFGDQALFAARALTAGGVCHCFEPSPSNLAMLEANAHRNSIANIKANLEALWSADDQPISLLGQDSHASPRLVDRQTVDVVSETVMSRTIDQYCDVNGIEQLDVLMLDIEGGEFEALLGARKTLARHGSRPTAVICEIHRAYVDWTGGLRQTPLCSLLIGIGYEVFAIRDYQGNEDMERTLVELVDIDTALLSGPPHGFNLLAVKSRDRLDPDVFGIVSHVSPKLMHHRDPKFHAPLATGHRRP